jgi:outer membrane protein OmpA-like peptidoglycan-associated protein
MRKIIFLILPIALGITLLSCSNQRPITQTIVGFTEKDTVLIMNNHRFAEMGIVGIGGDLVEMQRENVIRAQIAERERRLRGINGINIRSDGTTGSAFVATLGDNLLFAHDSFQLSTATMQALTELAAVINEMGNPQVRVVGHTDNTGSRAHNQRLSEYRASAVSQYLQVRGVGNITEVGMGMGSPIADNETEAGRRRNRRVEIEINFQ